MKKLIYCSLIVIGIVAISFSPSEGNYNCWSEYSEYGAESTDVCEGQYCTFKENIEVESFMPTDCASGHPFI